MWGDGLRGSVSTLATLLVSLMLITTLVTSYLLLHEASIKELKQVELRGIEKVKEASKDVDVSLDDGFLRIATSQPPLKVLVALAVYSNGSYKELAKDILLNPSNYVLNEDVLRSILDSGGKVFIVLSNGDYILIDDRLFNTLKEGNNGPSIIRYLLRPYIVLGEVYDASSYLENPIPGDDPSLSNYKPLLLSYLTNKTNVIFTYFTLKYIGNSYIRVNIHGDVTASLMVTIPMLIHRDENVYKRVLFHVVLRPTYCILYNYDVIMDLRTKIYVVPVIDYLRSPLVTELSDVMIGNQLGSSIAKSLYTEELQSSQLRASALAGQSCGIVSDEDIFIIEFNSTKIFEYIPKELDEVVALLTLQVSVYRTPPIAVNYSIIDIGLFDISEVYYIDVTNVSLINKPLLLLSKLPGLTARVLPQDGTALITYAARNVELKSYKSITWVNVSRVGEYSLNIIKGSSDKEADLPPPLNTVQYKIEIKSVSGEVKTVSVCDNSLSKYVIDPNNVSYVYTYVFTHEFSGRIQGSGWKPIRTVKVTYSNVPNTTLYTLTISSGDCPQTHIDWRPVTSSLRTYAYYEWYGQCRRNVKVSVTYDIENEELNLGASLTSYGEDYLKFDLTLMINETTTLNSINEDILKVYVGNDGDVKLLAIDLDELIEPIIK